MGQYILRRLLQAIPLIIVITVIVFFLMKTAGDPLAELALDPRIPESDRILRRAELGLTDPLPMQFVHWLIGDDWFHREIRLPLGPVSAQGECTVRQPIVGPNPETGQLIMRGSESVSIAVAPGQRVLFFDSTEHGLNQFVRREVVVENGECLQINTQTGERRGVLRGDLGESIAHQRPVVEVMGQYLPNTLLLGITSYIVIVVLAFSIGIFTALRQYSLWDNIITTLSFITVSMPIFLIALLSVYIFAVQFRQWGLPYLPVQGMYDVKGDKSFDELIRHMILPVFCLAAISIAGYSRYIRASMLEVINSDYVRTARAKGLGERRITYVHALKNASLPLVTLMGLDIPFLLAGAVVTERIFSWPGMGTLFIESLNRLDYSIVVVFVLMLAIAVVIFQLLTDILYAVLDPRVRFS